MKRDRHRSAAALLVACTLLLSACGGGGVPVKKKGTDATAVRTAVVTFGTAVQHKNYVKICDDLLAHALLEDLEQIGLPCVAALRQGLGAVEAPALEVRDVAVQGDKALASVHSVAAGQQPSDDAISLVREGGTWRIASLASPASTAGGLSGVRGSTTTTAAPTTTPTTTGSG